MHPLFIDDLIASAALFYLWYKRSKHGKSKAYSSKHSQSHQGHATAGHLSLDEAYRILGVKPDTSLKEIKKAYKEKISKSHPDKVSHLSKELQEKAKEITLKLNSALNTITYNKKN